HGAEFEYFRPVGAAHLRRYRAVHRLAVELDAGRDLHFEVDRHVIVVGAGAPVVTALADVLVSSAPWRGVDGTDRHALVRFHDFDLHIVGIGAARLLPRVTHRLGAAGQHRAHVAVHTFYF